MSGKRKKLTGLYGSSDGGGFNCDANCLGSIPGMIFFNHGVCNGFGYRNM
jgi:hypothetical protein